MEGNKCKVVKKRMEKGNKGSKKMLISEVVKKRKWRNKERKEGKKGGIRKVNEGRWEDKKDENKERKIRKSERKWKKQGRKCRKSKSKQRKKKVVVSKAI